MYFRTLIHFKQTNGTNEDKVIMKEMSLGLKEALRLTMEWIKPLPAENVALAESVDRIAAADLRALVDSPSVDASRKDGFAVLSRDLADATAENPVTLRVLGSIAAGGERRLEIQPGTAVKVLTGAGLPAGADAVVAEEFARQRGDRLLIETPVKSGKNILPRGSDAAFQKCILRSGQEISPVLAGLLAAAGHRMVPVFRSPVVGIIGTGDELVEPGSPLGRRPGLCKQYDHAWRGGAKNIISSPVWRLSGTIKKPSSAP